MNLNRTPRLFKDLRIIILFKLINKQTLLATHKITIIIQTWHIHFCHPQDIIAILLVFIKILVVASLLKKL